GGMTAAISALHAFHDIEHVWPNRRIPEPNANRLYSSWVSNISIEKLLDTSDLTDGRETLGTNSLLCTDVLDEITNAAFEMKGEPRYRDWLGRGNDRTLRILITVSNLRGVPYSFNIFGSDKQFGMLNHGDYLDFTMGIAPPRAIDSYVLDVTDFAADGWKLFKTVTLATGAFPVGLAPRSIVRRSSDYRTVQIVGYEDPSSGEFKIIPPSDKIDHEKMYRF